MNQEIETKVLDLLAAKIGVRPSCSDDLALLSLDSLALVEFSAEIERTFQVKLDDRILEANTVGDVVTYVANLLAKSPVRVH